MNMKKSIIVFLSFLFSVGFSNGQGPVKKKKSANNVASQKSTTSVDEHATTNDSIKIVNGRKVYIDKNGVQSFKVVN